MLDVQNLFRARTSRRDNRYPQKDQVGRKLRGEDVSLLRLYRCECGRNLSMTSILKSVTMHAYILRCKACSRHTVVDQHMFEKGTDPLFHRVVEIDWHENFEVRA